MPKWLDVARKYEGLTEVKGPASNPVILGWLQNEGGGKSWVKDDATPWCGAAMAGVFTEAGLSDILPKEPLRARSWATVGEALPSPKVGCIVVIERNGNPQEGHVGLVEKFDANHIWIRGGNQSDAFNVRAFPIATTVVVAYRWPLKTLSPNDMQAQGSRIATAARRQQVDSAKGTGFSGSTQVPAIPDAIPSPKAGIDDALSNFSWAKGVWATICEFAVFTGTHWWLIAIIVAGYYFARIAWDGHNIRLWRTQDTNEGWTQ